MYQARNTRSLEVTVPVYPPTGAHSLLAFIIRSSGSWTVDFDTHMLKLKGFCSASFQSEDSHGRTHLSLGTEVPKGQPSEAA